MFKNPRRDRQARNFTINVSKILDLKSSSEQIFSRKLKLGAPDRYDPVDYHGNRQPAKRFQFFSARCLSRIDRTHRKVFPYMSVSTACQPTLTPWSKTIRAMETDPDDYIMYWHLMQGNPRQPWMLNSRLWILGSRGGLILSVEIVFWTLLEQNYGFHSRRFYGFHIKNFPYSGTWITLWGFETSGWKKKWVNKSSPWKCNFGGLVNAWTERKGFNFIFIKYHFIFNQVL